MVLMMGQGEFNVLFMSRSDVISLLWIANTIDDTLSQGDNLCFKEPSDNQLQNHFQ